MMSSLLLPILSVVLNLNEIHSQILCANEESYCLPGLGPSDLNRYLSTQYVIAGTINNCTYFKSANNVPKYLFKHAATGYWLIANNMTDNTYQAYCNEHLLDDCTKTKWVYWNGATNYYHPYLEIEPCTYNNTVCENLYETNNKSNRYCLSNVDHRDNNKIVRGQYKFKGCYMNQPYFVKQVTNNVLNTTTNYTIFWEDVLSIWHISNDLNGGSFFGYCNQKDISDCSQNWYIYSGSAFVVDNILVSGYCDSCINNGPPPYNETCIIGGVESSSNPVIGRYTYNGCEHLYPSYKMSHYPYYTLSYESFFEQYLIVDVDTKIRARCNGSDITACIEYIEDEPQWKVSKSGVGYVNTDLVTSSCANVDAGCQNRSDYCLDIEGVAFIEYSGIYKFNECIDNIYPSYTQYKDRYGVNVTDAGVISFDALNNLFIISGSIGTYAVCNALLLDECNGFWSPNTRNLTLYKCDKNKIITTTTPSPTATTTSTSTTTVVTTSESDITTSDDVYNLNSSFFDIASSTSEAESTGVVLTIGSDENSTTSTPTKQEIIDVEERSESEQLDFWDYQTNWWIYMIIAGGALVFIICCILICICCQRNQYTRIKHSISSADYHNPGRIV